jgi:hypothetical protein
MMPLVRQLVTTVRFFMMHDKLKSPAAGTQ